MGLVEREREAFVDVFEVVVEFMVAGAKCLCDMVMRKKEGVGIRFVGTNAAGRESRQLWSSHNSVRERKGCGNGTSLSI